MRALVLVLAVAGCVPILSPPEATLRPEPPRGAIGDTVTLQVRRVSSAGGSNGDGPFEGTDIARSHARPQLVITVDVRARAPVPIRGAWLAAPEATPCAAGFEVETITVDEQVRWSRPLVVEGGSLALGFMVPDEALTGATVLDVAVGEGPDSRCLRHPLGGRDERLVDDSPWVLAGAIRLHAGLTPPLPDIVSLRGGVGRWFGPVRAGVELGFGGGACACPGGALVVGGLPFRWARFAIGASAGYEAVDDVPRRIWREFALTHGPRLSIQLLETPPRMFGAPRAVAGRGVELMVARLTGIGDARDARWVFAIGVVNQ